MGAERVQLHEDCVLIEAALARAFDGCLPMASLLSAMEYSLLAGGKRIRPVLTLAVCRMCGGDVMAVLPLACAGEMVHTYSLIHDDLPCMDDDDLRRGKPSNHKVYGEAVAVLAGDALLTAAFETALSAPLPSAQVLAATACLAGAVGVRGMVGGQALDMAAEGRAVSRQDVEQLQALKTGALLAAAAEMGCIAAGGDEAARLAVRTFAQKLGLAFQMRDDVLDVTGSAKVLGKPVGSDSENEKTTFVTLLGIEGTRAQIAVLTREAVDALSGMGDTAFLSWLASELAGREA